MQKRIFISFAVIVLSVTFFSCFKKQDKNAAKEDITDVFVIKTVKADVKWDVIYPAKISAVELLSKVTGEIKEINYDTGKYLRQGEQMFFVYKPSYRSSYDSASLDFAAIKPVYEAAKKKIARTKKLYAAKTIKKSTYSQALEEYQSIEDEYKAAKEAVDISGKILKNTKVKAPVAGIAAKPSFEQGKEITDKDKEVLAYIFPCEPMKVSFSISRIEADRLLDGFLKGKLKLNIKTKNTQVPAEGIFLNGKKFDIKGKIVSLISSSVEENSAVTVNVEFPSAGRTKNIIEDENIGIKIPGAYFKDAVVISKECIFKNAGRDCVYVVKEDNTIVPVPVICEKSENFAFVVSGLEGGETIVSYSSKTLSEGKKVNPAETTFFVPEKYKAVIPEPETTKTVQRYGSAKKRKR